MCKGRSLYLPQLIALVVVAALLGSVVPARGQARGQAPLPEGTGKELVQSVCSQCHGLNLVTNAGYTRDSWQTLFSTMVALPGDQAAQVAEYLAGNFPEKPKPQPVLIPGGVSVSIKEWLVPSLGSRPHDPLSAPDGSIWWTGQWANVLGRLDPATGVLKEYPLKTPKSGPHGLVADKDGHIWFTAVSGGYVGKLDPKTGEVTEYRPDVEMRGPHTPIFDQNGTLWFTTQGGMVGRVVPSTGEVKLAATPTPNSYPYGIAVNSKGVPWYVDFRGNRVGTVDPQTMEIREFTLPDAAARPRRIAITSDDVVWYTDYARGYLGRFDPRTGQVSEWSSPGGTGSRPYGIAAVGDVLWYSESGVSPNTLVRFDAQTKTFQTWVIPSGGGVVRNMMATAEGNLVLACSGVNRVALVEVKDSGRSE